MAESPTLSNQASESLGAKFSSDTIIFGQMVVTDKEQEQSQIDIKQWLRNKLINEADRYAPHGPIEIVEHYNKKLRLTKVQVYTKWKEPVQ